METLCLPVMQTLEDVEKEYDKTLTEIKRLQERLRMLRTHRYQLVAISRLPVENLAEIFLLAQTVRHKPGSWSYDRVPIVLASVCHHWRQTVLSTPFLWCHIDFHRSIPRLERALERSENVPLIVDVSFGGDRSYNPDKMLSILHNVLPRIKNFRCSNDGAALTIQGGPTKVSGNLLEALHLDNIAFTDFFGPELPNLRRLSLKNCSFDWDEIPSTPNLRVFRLDSPLSDSESDSLVNYLETVPLLEELELQTAIFDYDLFDCHEDDRISLSQLRSIRVEGVLNLDAVNFFESIAIPNTTEIFLQVDGDEGETDYETSIQGLYLVQAARGISWNTSALVIEILFSQITLNIHEKLVETRPEGQGSSTCTFVFDGLDATVLMVHSCGVLNLANLVTLDVSAKLLDQIVPISIWARAFGQLPNLQILKARADMSSSLVECFIKECTNVPASGEAQLSSTSLSFPGLKTLAMEGCLRSGVNPHDLVSVFQARLKYNCHLDRLVFYSGGDHCKDLNREDGLLLPWFRNFAHTVEQLSHSEF